MRRQGTLARSCFVCLAVVVVSPASGAQVSCYDLSRSEPHELTGVLSHAVFAGPPNFEDVQNGDAPEPGYLLTLPLAICLSGDDFADPGLQFSEVQLVATDSTAAAMRSLVNAKVRVVLSNAMAAETGHHHRPLIAWVAGISAANVVTTEPPTSGR